MLKNNFGFAVTTMLRTMVQKFLRKLPRVDVYFDAWNLILALRMA